MYNYNNRAATGFLSNEANRFLIGNFYRTNGMETECKLSEMGNIANFINSK